MRIILPIVAALSTVGCSGVLRGPENCTEIHFDATYVLARWAGWSPDEALTIAAADAWTDRNAETTSVATERRLLGGLVNPTTIPWILWTGMGDVIVDGEAPGRAFGQRAAESTAWAVPATGHLLHFPAVGLRTAVLPAFYVNPVSGEIEYGSMEARRVLERAFLDLQTHDEDLEATLVLLGIGLHQLQDSIKHSGFNASRGHIGADPDPDSACCNPGAAILSAEVTLNSLRYARRLLTGSSRRPPTGWKEQFRRIFEETQGKPAIAESRWAKFVEEQFKEESCGRESRILRWQTEHGGDAFTRALVKVEETLR